MLVAAVVAPGPGLVGVLGVGEAESVIGLSPEPGRETSMSKYICLGFFLDVVDADTSDAVL